MFARKLFLNAVPGQDLHFTSGQLANLLAGIEDFVNEKVST